MERGMTLIETMVWIAIFVATMLALSSSVLYFYRTSSYAIQEATAVTSAQRGVDSMVRTVRETAYSSIGAYPIIAMATSSFTFYANVDTDAGVEQVRYFISGTNLMRGVVEPSGDPAVYTGGETTNVVTDNVKNSEQGTNIFDYYDQNGAQITDFTQIASVRFVTVSIVTDIDPNRTPTLTTLRSSTALRNLTQ